MLITLILWAICFFLPHNPLEFLALVLILFTVVWPPMPPFLPPPPPLLFAMFLVREATEVAWGYTVSAIFCMVAFISDSWTLAVLPLLRLLILERLITAAVLVRVIDTLRPWFSISAVFLSWITDLSSNAAMYSIAAALASTGASRVALRFLSGLHWHRAAALSYSFWPVYFFLGQISLSYCFVNALTVFSHD